MTARKKTARKKGRAQTAVHQHRPARAAGPAKLMPVEITIEHKGFGEAPEQHHFILQDGKVLRSVYDLACALEHMADDVFRSHVNDVKNDFASWLHDIYGAEDLAKELRQVHGRMDTELRLLRHMVRNIGQ